MSMQTSNYTNHGALVAMHNMRTWSTHMINHADGIWWQSCILAAKGKTIYFKKLVKFKIRAPERALVFQIFKSKPPWQHAMILQTATGSDSLKRRQATYRCHTLQVNMFCKHVGYGWDSKTNCSWHVTMVFPSLQLRVTGDLKHSYNAPQVP